MAKLTKIAKLARFLRLMRLVRLLRLDRIMDHLEHQIGPAGTAMLIYWMQLLRWLVTVLFVCHWNACIWWIVGKAGGLLGSPDEDDGEKHWTSEWRKELGTEDKFFRWIDQPRDQQYLFCLYWSLGVMRTMPTEVYPVNAGERFYTIWFMFVACSIFAVCITKVTTMFSKISEKRSALSEGLATLKSYMHSYGVDSSLQHRCVDYLEAMFTAGRLRSNEQRYLDELSTGLRAEVLVATNGPAIMQHWVFASIHQDTIIEIVFRSAVHILAEEELACSAGDLAVRGWFRMTGKFQITHFLSHADSDGRPAVSIPKRVDYVDVECLCMVDEVVSPFSVRAVEFAESVVLQREKMLQLFAITPGLADQMTSVLESGPARKMEMSGLGGTDSSTLAQRLRAKKSYFSSTSSRQGVWNPSEQSARAAGQAVRNAAMHGVGGAPTGGDFTETSDGNAMLAAATINVAG